MPQSRQLAAIMFTDVVGYTALMGNDEQKAFSILNKPRGITSDTNDSSCIERKEEFLKYIGTKVSIKMFI